MEDVFLYLFIYIPRISSKKNFGIRIRIGSVMYHAYTIPYLYVMSHMAHHIMGRALFV